MPRRNSGGRPGGSRPSVAPTRSSAPQSQSRPATTAAYPPATQRAPTQPAAAQQQGSQGPGLFGQMASTAAGVAVGSSIGHAIGGFFGGGSSAPAAAQQDNAIGNNDAYSTQTYDEPSECAFQIRSFQTCMNENEGNMTICQWYMTQLKACQQASRNL